MGSYTGVHGLRPEGVFRGAVLVPDTERASASDMPCPPLDAQPEAMYLLAGERGRALSWPEENLDA